MSAGHYGYVSKEEGRVVTSGGVDDLQAVKTLIHEKAHVAMHVGFLWMTFRNSNGSLKRSPSRSWC